jgi:hypothetical protein
VARHSQPSVSSTTSADLADWRELFALAKADPALRRRIVAVIARVPVPLPRLWLAALVSLGERVDLDMQLPRYEDAGI